MMHFIGFRNPLFHKDSRYDNAVKAFGKPDMMLKDGRAPGAISRMPGEESCILERAA